MRFGTFHKKKRYLINKVKINILSFFLKNKNDTQINSETIRSCLLIHDNNKLGDLIVLSALYRALATRGIKLYIVSCSAGHVFLHENQHIKHLFIKKSNSIRDTLNVLKELKNIHFDVVLDPFETFPRFSHSLLLSGLNATFILGFDKWYKRYYSSYHPHDEDLHAHMSTRARIIIQSLFGDDTEFDEDYDLPVPAAVDAEVRKFVGDSRVVVVNPLGAKKICRLTAEQITLIHRWIVENHPELRIIYTGHPDDLSVININGIETLPGKEFIHTIALVKYCNYVVSVDTALVHVASAYGRPTFALYPEARNADYPSPLIWAPNNQHALQIISPTCSVGDIDSHSLITGLQSVFDK